MKFIVLHVLYAFCVFYAVGDELVEFKKSLDEVTQRIVDYEQQFSSSVIVLVSNLKDTSTGTLMESWNGTMTLINLLYEDAKTEKMKDCIGTESAKLRVIINSVPFSLDSCRENSAATGQSVRKKFQSLHERILNLTSEVDTIRPSCSQEGDKSEQCIFSKILGLRVPFRDIVNEFDNNLIDKGNIKPIILSDAMKCNAKVLKDTYEIETDIMQKLRQCS